MEIPDPEFRICANCEQDVPLESNYCRFCGYAHNQVDVVASIDKKKHLNQVFIFFAVELIFCVSTYFIEDFNMPIALCYDGILAISAILFFSYEHNWAANKFLLKWPNFSTIKLIGLIVGTVIASILVQLAVTQLNQLMFQKDYSFYETYSEYSYGIYIMIISVALFPALFEELAYRGFLMQKLFKVVEPKEAIYITSIIFFLMHLSMISFFWMLPFAFILAYVRLKTNTIWYGVVMHFFFNLTACVTEIYFY